MCVNKSIKVGCQMEGCPIGFPLKSGGGRWVIMNVVAKKIIVLPCVS